MMESLWEKPMCVPNRIGCYIVVLIDCIFIIICLAIHIVELVRCLSDEFNCTNTPYYFLSVFIFCQFVNGILTGTLFQGVKQKQLNKCQNYMFGSVLMTVIGGITYIVYACLKNQLENTTKHYYYLYYYFEIICYPLFYVFKIYCLWVVKCFIVELIREKRALNNTSFNTNRTSNRARIPDYGGNGYNSTTTTNPSPTIPMRYTSPGGRRESVSYERVHGIDDILHQVEFPKDNQISSDYFTIGDELLKMDDDFYVKKGTLQISPGTYSQVSVKIFKPKVEVEAVRAMLLETKILSMFQNHNNVLQLIGFCTENIHKGKMILILEYCEKGNLEDYLKDNYVNFQDLMQEDEYRIIRQSDPSEPEETIYENVMEQKSDNFTFNSRTLVNWAFQIANGMEFIIGKDVIHGNLSTKNCIVDRHRIKIGNFTFATQLYKCRGSNTTVSTKGDLPWRWMALECLQNENFKIFENFTEKSDVWSYGVTVWEIFSLALVPYEGESTSEFFPKLLAGKRLEKPPYATSQVYQIMRDCWQHDPKQRPRFNRLKVCFAEVLQNFT